MESRTTIQEDDDSYSEDSNPNYTESEYEDAQEHLDTEIGRMSLAESDATGQGES